MSLLKESSFCMICATKCALYVTKKLAFKKRFRNGSAVYRYKSPIFSWTSCVDRTRYKLFSRSTFSGYKDSCLVLRNPFCKIYDSSHFLAYKGYLFKSIILSEFLTQEDIFPSEPFSLLGHTHAKNEFLCVDWLAYIIR